MVAGWAAAPRRRAGSRARQRHADLLERRSFRLAVYPRTTKRAGSWSNSSCLARKRSRPADVAAMLPLTRREAENELEKFAINGRALRLGLGLYGVA
jgi:hypothetical protein